MCFLKKARISTRSVRERESELDLWYSQHSSTLKILPRPPTFLSIAKEPRSVHHVSKQLVEQSSNYIFFNAKQSLDFIAFENISTLMNKHVKIYERETLNCLIMEMNEMTRSGVNEGATATIYDSRGIRESCAERRFATVGWEKYEEKSDSLKGFSSWRAALLRRWRVYVWWTAFPLAAVLLSLLLFRRETLKRETLHSE